MSAYQNCQTDL